MRHTTREVPAPASPIARGSSGSIRALVPAFRRSLRAGNRSPRTVRGYCDDVGFLTAYLEDAGLATEIKEIRREHIEMFISDQLARHRPATAATRYRSARQFFRWALEEGELTASPMINVRPPIIPEEPPAVLSDDELRRLLKACEGTTFVDRRDTAIVRLFLDTGMRLAELSGLTSEDLDLDGASAASLAKAVDPASAHSEIARAELWTAISA